MNIYEEFEKLREIISDEDQVICGLKTDQRGEVMRRNAMSTMTAMNIGEDENRSDSETVFFFISEGDARMCFTQAVNLGLVSGEVTFDPTVSESFGVGKYAVRFAPHVGTAKREVLYTLWNKGMGGRGSPRMYESWMEETGGALMVGEDVFAQASQASGTGHPKASSPMGQDAVFSQSAPQSVGSAGDDPVQNLTTKETGRYPAAYTGAADPSEGAFQTFHAAATPNAGAMHDFVHDGTNGTPIMARLALGQLSIDTPPEFRAMGTSKPDAALHDLEYRPSVDHVLFGVSTWVIVGITLRCAMNLSRFRTSN